LPTLPVYCIAKSKTAIFQQYYLYILQIIICPMRQQHWTDYKISLCVCQSVSQSVIESVSESVSQSVNFWTPHISWTVEARNFKLGIQIGHWGS